MKLLDRLANLVKSNLNAAIDTLSDPAKEIDLLVEQMETEVKRGRLELRDHLAQEKLSQKKAEEAYRNVQRWHEHAERAVAAGDDDLAKEALKRQAEAEKVQEDTERTVAEQSRLVHDHTQRIKDNDRKLAEIKSRKETLKARARAAKQSLSVEGSAFDRFDQLASQIEVSEHQAEAMRDMAEDPDLNPRLGTSKDQETNEKFARLLGSGRSDKDQEVEDRLAELKAKLDKRE
jgi:phage shock protein A